MFRKIRLLLASVATLPVLAAVPADVPAALQVQEGQSLVLTAHGVGDQIYTCRAGADGTYAWTLKAPDAKLMGTGGELVGRHFAGPSWEAKDGSRVQGKPVANVAAPGGQSIPWLLLNVTAHEGQGLLTPVTSIQRLHTQGGKAPAEGCDAAHADGVTRVPYQADYYFYGASSR